MEKAAGCNPILTLDGRVPQRVTLAAAAVGAGLYFGWRSLAALGLTGIFIPLLPCILICAAGIHMSRMGKKEGP